MAVYAGPVQDLIDELGRLPGVGPKSAQRIAFHLLKLPKQDALRLARAIAEAKDRVAFCARCFNVAEGELCGICADARRDATSLRRRGAPRRGRRREDRRVPRAATTCCRAPSARSTASGPTSCGSVSCSSGIEPEGIAEVILCTNPNLEGEATAMYLGRLLTPLGLKVTRIASGLPVGGDLEYADELTLGRALEGRRQIES